MKSRQLFGKGTLLALSALFVTACNGNAIEGSLAGHEFGQIKTAFFDLEDMGASSPIPVMLMVDVEWTCEDVNLLFASLDAEHPDEALFTDSVIGGLFLEFGKVSDDGETALGSTDLTDYTVLDPLGEAPAAGSHFVFGLALVGKVDANTGDEVAFLTQSGTLSLNKFEDKKGMGGEFDITMVDEAEQTEAISGTFNLSYCDFDLDLDSEARLTFASQSLRFPGARR